MYDKNEIYVEYLGYKICKYYDMEIKHMRYFRETWHGVKRVRTGVILVRSFPGFSRIRTKYGEILGISPYSVRMRENPGKMRTRITPITDSSYAV